MTHQERTPTLSPELLRLAWMTVALLWPVALLNYLDRQMLAAMKFSVMGEITSIGSETNWGHMLGQFKWVYAVLSPVGGYIADRFSRRLVIVSSLFVWSAVTWATGHVTDFHGLLWTRTLMGISEAFYFPAALALIADHHTGDTRSRAVGVHQMGIYCGVIVGGFSGYVADSPQLGWRFAFDITGIVGVLYAIPLFLFLRNAPRSEQRRADAQAVKPTLALAVGELLTNRFYLLLVGYFTLPSLAGWVVRDWMPAILKERFDITQGASGVFATLPMNVAALGGAFLGGWIADQLMGRTLRGRIYTSAFGMSLLIPSLFGVGNAGSLSMAILFLALFGIGWGFFDCNNMPILSQIVRPELRATGYGIMNLVGISVGGFADRGFGMLLDRHVPLNVIFAVFASTALLSVILVLLIRPQRHGD
ncbi:MAG: MFS transporter [Pirellulales bacterium]|nr:MFS transporter [Pirellulales bacterium]